ncbi:MAG TPA: MlaD family protein [Steroidobacteraceae bacterium]
MTDEELLVTRRRRTAAGRRKTWWPGWIWAVPLAAIGIVVWLMLRALSSRGVGVTVVFDDAGGMAANSTKVRYRGLEVGTVTNLSLAPDGRHVLAHLDIDGDMHPYVNAGTRFYLIGARPTFTDPASLKALVSGPSITLVPGGGPRADRFTGIEGSPPERLEVAIPYAATFGGARGDILAGSPVLLGGFDVGEVSNAELVTDPKTGGLETRVVLLLDPTRFRIEGAAKNGEDWTKLMNTTLDALVRSGLRATVALTPPVIGAPQVALEMEPGESAAPGNADQTGETGASHDTGASHEVAAGLDFSGHYPRIPTVSDGGLTAFTQQLARVPLGQIASNVRAITERVKTLAGSPQLDDSIRHLDRSLAELDTTLRTAGPQVAPTLASVRDTVAGLRQTANDIDSTSETARRVMNSNVAAPGESLQQALRELSDAARSIRSLADYLDQHPEALIRGRQ